MVRPQEWDPTVIVKRLGMNSLLQGTSVEEGSEILAVNGEAVYSPGQVSNVCKACVHLEFTTIKPALATRKSPFCYVKVAPTSRIHPGVSFDGCFGRSMVMISHVLVSNLYMSSCWRYYFCCEWSPVWKPEDADRDQLKAALAFQALVLYCIDMDSLHDHIVVKAQGSITVGPNNEILTSVIRKRE